MSKYVTAEIQQVIRKVEWAMEDAWIDGLLPKRVCKATLYRAVEIGIVTSDDAAAYISYRGWDTSNIRKADDISNNGYCIKEWMTDDGYIYMLTIHTKGEMTLAKYGRYGHMVNRHCVSELAELLGRHERLMTRWMQDYIDSRADVWRSMSPDRLAQYKSDILLRMYHYGLHKVTMDYQSDETARHIA